MNAGAPTDITPKMRLSPKTNGHLNPDYFYGLESRVLDMVQETQKELLR